ncbi:uncharacterized protein PV09_03834 [Verruconis gallopava]|uniref:O-methyltransferase domain-containing protein n=1 Tax=Verruconis gallopava TaxID=253628 RepID=A0A0D2B1V7_9PEZI|nr:uncharacterized protein PV09_03834 [Verruconis gallopava]KIW05309.1 hypothetical protein PV09_03834 [Verruconis gallopava]
MDLAEQLEIEAQELNTLFSNLVSALRGSTVPTRPVLNPTTAFDLTFPAPQPASPSKQLATKIQEARQAVLAQIAKARSLLLEPADLLQQLAVHNQLIACLHWLADFLVLACIPSNETVPIKDVAQLLAVPESQLVRVIRMTATVGFLQEPQPGHVAHTALSRFFLSRNSNRDAAIFLAQYAAPAALEMASDSPGSPEKEQFLSFNGDSCDPPLRMRAQGSVRLQRQWRAYCEHVLERWDADDIAKVLSRLDWSNLPGNAQVVETCARSLELSSILSERHPNLHFVVQMDPSQSPGDERSESPSTMNGCLGVDVDGAPQAYHSSPRIVVESRIPGTPQPIPNAAVYILSMPPLSSRFSLSQPADASVCIRSWIVSELKAHLDILKAGNSTLIISTGPILPEPGTVDPEFEALTRLRDLSLYQLFMENEMETQELFDIVTSIKDDSGQLLVVNQLRSQRKILVALCVKYQHVNT